MRGLTQEEILEMLCAPEAVDEPEESDFIDSDELYEEAFVRSLIAREIRR